MWPAVKIIPHDKAMKVTGIWMNARGQLDQDVALKRSRLHQWWDLSSTYFLVRQALVYLDFA
eukprot:8770600-Pyramimonas_sp.AAC.1